MVKDDSKKNPSFIAFFKLFLFDVKVEILLSSCYFLMAFYIHPFISPLPPLLTATLIFLLMKGVEVAHNWTKFHLDGTCISGVLIFEIFV